MPAPISIFDQVKKLAKNADISTKSVAWFKTQVNKLSSGGKVTPDNLLKDHKKLTPDIFIGNMFMYYYDPKYKNVLPYYDRFPLIIPIDIQKDGFLGLNLHYLYPKYRVALLQKLTDFQNNKLIDKNTRLKTTYTMLSNISRFPEVQPCIKKYLYKHVMSNFIAIGPEDWITAIFLPVEKFTRAKESVWKLSLNMMKIPKRP